MTKPLVPACVAAILFGLAPGFAEAAARAACPVAGTQPISIVKASPGGFVAEGGAEIRVSGLLSSDIGEAALGVMRSAGPLSYAGTGASDRYERIPAQLFAGGKWVQGELLRMGLARVHIEPRDTPCARSLFAAEEEGRKTRAGHWGDGTFDVLSADGLQRRGGTFQIVEGKVESTAIIRGRAFINFGPDYRTDFTVTIAPSDMGAFRRAKFDIRALAGKRVRVRGFIDFYNGPEMDVALPEAIEVLEPTPPS
jgi:micrococcal nuclease